MSQLFGQIDQLLHFAAVHRFEQCFARGKMPIEACRMPTPAAARDGFEAGFWPTGTEHSFLLPQEPARGSELRRRVAFAFLFRIASYRPSNLDPLEKRRMPPYIALS